MTAIVQSACTVSMMSAIRPVAARAASAGASSSGTRRSMMTVGEPSAAVVVDRTVAGRVVGVSLGGSAWAGGVSTILTWSPAARVWAGTWVVERATPTTLYPGSGVRSVAIAPVVSVAPGSKSTVAYWPTTSSNWDASRAARVVSDGSSTVVRSSGSICSPRLTVAARARTWVDWPEEFSAAMNPKKRTTTRTTPRAMSPGRRRLATGGSVRLPPSVGAGWVCMSCVISGPDVGLVEVGVQRPGDEVGSVLCAGLLDEAVEDVFVALLESQRELNAIDAVLAASTGRALEERAARWSSVLGCREGVEVLLDG